MAHIFFNITGLVSSFLIIIFATDCIWGSTVSDDPMFKIWVFFNDKPPKNDILPISPRGLARRVDAGFTEWDYCDLPVSTEYLRRIEALGAVLHVVYKWENCASFYARPSQLSDISKLPFVRMIRPVATYRDNNFQNDFFLSKKSRVDTLYGHSSEQLNFNMIIETHDYLKRFRKLPIPGKGVLIAFFDGGARFDHRCFSYLKQNHSVKAIWDFVQNDSIIWDDDSIATNSKSIHYRDDMHGTHTLSLVAAYDPGFFMGCAWGADLALAKTENGVLDGESHSEEDNWAAAVVWAESLGVDIISSSLGYRDDFEDSIVIHKNGYDTVIWDYGYSELDGNTTLISRAANYAIARGMVVVTAVGNEGSQDLGTLSAPADVEEVISVGAVNANRKVGYFSSTGPTFDGRIKPDLVTLGLNVVVPSIYSSSTNSYTTSQGTSFAAPLISGICALILQSHDRQIGVQKLREQLFKFCRYTEYQDTVDNHYGRGIPDALLSCMRKDEVYIRLTDSLDNPVMFTTIRDSRGDVLGKTDLGGIALLRIPEEKIPLDARVRLNEQIDSFVISSTPSHFNIKITTIAPAEKFFLFPTVLKRSSGDLLKVEFYNPSFQHINSSIRALSGELIWKKRISSEQLITLELSFNNELKRIAPGLYFLIIEEGGRVFRKKFMIMP